MPASLSSVELRNLLFSSGEADAETFDFAERTFALGLGDPVVQVVPNLFKPWPFTGGLTMRTGRRTQA